MQTTANRTTAGPTDDATELACIAFREVHATRLHGFALLLTLGDRFQAAHLADEALDVGCARMTKLRHPERAAAWLRARVVRKARLRRGSDDEAAARLAGLSDLAVDEAILLALSSLTNLERAALVASAIERFDLRDVATIAGRDGARLDALLRAARKSFAAWHAAASPLAEPPSGPITDRIRDIAARAMA